MSQHDWLLIWVLSFGRILCGLSWALVQKERIRQFSIFSCYLPLLFQSRCEKLTHTQTAYLSQPGRASTGNELFWSFLPIVPLAELLNQNEKKGRIAHIAISGLFCIMWQNLAAKALVLTGMATVTCSQKSDSKILLQIKHTVFKDGG